jgi:hypothetical protein
LHLQLRNFADSQLRAQDLGVQVTLQDPSQGSATIKQEYLTKSLNAKSLNEVREALEFQFNESAADHAQNVKVTLTYQGKAIDSTVLQVVPRFMLQLELAETPSLKEGLPMPVRVKVKNIGNQPAQGVVLNLKANADQLEVAQPTSQVGAIAAGETKTVEYSVTGRDLSDSSTVQMGFVATEGASVSGRRVGVLDLSRQFPVVNDYRIDLANSGVAALRTAGLTRLNYTIKNVSRRLMYNSLQVKVTFRNTEDAANFVVVGPNPQYLLPMDQGETTSFTIPVLVKAANRGGVIEVEVQEAGRTVVIHREDFSQGQSLN